MSHIKKILIFFTTSLIFFSYNYSLAEDSYYTFSDYGEFDIVKEEEQDVNFFNDGRFLSLGLALERSVPIGDLSEIYGGSFGVNIFATYFFDLRFALQVNIGEQDHKYQSADGSIKSSAKFKNLGIGIKYYVNPDKIVYSLSRFNPYIITSVSLITELRSLPGVEDLSEVSHSAYNFGLGFELPLPGKKFFISTQVVYNFSSSYGQEDGFGNKTGDFIKTSVIMGLNF
ncbi:MAG: outer membrane beta-barrel protein [Bdellovibrionales bacterium]|nr:outer membrane beta-barrel protein [Bdellovibrionales bacterium]